MKYNEYNDDSWNDDSSDDWGSSESDESWEDASNNKDIEFLDRFIESEIYKQICLDADMRKDPDSIVFLDSIIIHLDSIMFHINRDSTKDRVDYELLKFRELVKDFLE